MKKFVKASKVKDNAYLTGGEYYQSFAEFEDSSYTSGLVVVVLDNDGEYKGYDSSFFE